ncbi:MAG: hypothetical protein Q7K42_03990, partial [Candidatus Diapherotrites archaeon]|nr:hypothetical protein [Candidatus Diapherotrites archaeon]
MKTNSFGCEIPEIKDVFNDPVVETSIRKRFLSVLNFLDIEDPEKVVEFTLEQAKKEKLPAYERNVHNLFDQKRINQRIPAKLSNRAQTIFDQIKDYVKGHLVLDLGGGDGKIGELIAKQGRQVVLSDVYEHGNIVNTHLPFVKIKPN